MKKVLVTGVDGFVAGYLSDYLFKSGYDVYGTTISETYKNDKIKIFKMNLLDAENVSDVIKNISPNMIFHLAGQSAVGLSWQKPVLTIDVNVNGTLNLLEAVRINNINSRILIIGSSDQYGTIKPEDCPIKETQLQNPQSPYGISKKTQEEIGKLYVKAYKMNIIFVRAFNHIGARQGKNFVVPDFASKIVKIEKSAVPVLKVGNLDTLRDFTDVRDIVRGYLMLLESGKIGESYNIGSGNVIKIKDILKKLINLSSKKIKIEIDKEKFRPVDVPIVQCDNSKIKKDTGWSPEISIDETLKEVLEYWRGK
ncbi:GDP-mannose 4,6-dehydratase [Leptotrichia sp. oral taxon 417]|jgi:GDP-4-dehydro-6-deoxy-D-mannose reductase|uniref:GDP-mannose 4,6-dehydratase n=1 Tax=Leptotrichia sp. oral taxon 417 TaxID=712365 RepID=UPI0015B9FB6C|nr:GDP-mannose 4,6-dehydratase [Leptotrichia sp. oral taxon 417]NWO26310.1 GDP-mannose 4,6-dehydratase [Leptotrichia sp. oral taxon 417]